MKKLLLIGLGIVGLLQAETLKLTLQQEQDWQIKTALAERSELLPLGIFMAEVTTPPQNLYTISLPFDTQVQKLYVGSYETVQKGQLLAEVTGKDWIAIQQQFIENAIELKHHGHIAQRKNRLCKEEIIPKKECHDANAEYKADKVKIAASKALLKGYGADETMIDNLLHQLKITQSIPIRSEVTGQLLELNIRVGKSTLASDALFVIQKEGDLWLESAMVAQKAMQLKEGEKVNIDFAGKEFQSQVLLHAPTINPENQTQKVRFTLSSAQNIRSGMKDTATINIVKISYKVAKTSVINHEGKNIVFLKSTEGYEPMEVTILAEEGNTYFVESNPKLQKPIATTSIAILKGLMD